MLHLWVTSHGTLQVSHKFVSDFEDRFLLEEGVYWRYMTDEKRNIDHKDIRIVQVILNDYLRDF